MNDDIFLFVLPFLNTVRRPRLRQVSTAVLSATIKLLPGQLLILLKQHYCFFVSSHPVCTALCEQGYKT